MVNALCQAEADPGVAEVNPDDADSQSDQAGAEPDHIKGLGTARQAVDQDGRRLRTLPGRWDRLQHDQAVGVGQVDLVGGGFEARPRGRPVSPDDGLGVPAPQPGMRLERGELGVAEARINDVRLTRPA